MGGGRGGGGRGGGGRGRGGVEGSHLSDEGTEGPEGKATSRLGWSDGSGSE